MSWLSEKDSAILDRCKIAEGKIANADGSLRFTFKVTIAYDPHDVTYASQMAYRLFLLTALVSSDNISTAELVNSVLRLTGHVPPYLDLSKIIPNGE